MEKLERLAGQLARDFEHLIVPANDEELLEAANLVTELADEFTAFQERLGQPPAGPLVLLVEPDAADRALIRDLLASLGYATLEAAFGAEALDRCAGHAGAIHAMLTNILMPDMSGRELAERVALLRPEMGVVYMSGYTDEEIIFYGVLGPGVLTLPKPIDPATLAQRLAAAIEAPLAGAR